MRIASPCVATARRRGFAVAGAVATGAIVATLAFAGFRYWLSRETAATYVEASRKPSAVTAFVVSNEFDCKGAVLAADFLLWDSVRGAVAIGAVLVSGSTPHVSAAVRSTGSALVSVVRRPTVLEQLSASGAMVRGGAQIVLVDDKRRILLRARLTHDWAQKRALATLVSAVATTNSNH